MKETSHDDSARQIHRCAPHSRKICLACYCLLKSRVYFVDAEAGFLTMREPSARRSWMEAISLLSSGPSHATPEEDTGEAIVAAAAAGAGAVAGTALAGASLSAAGTGAPNY